VSAAAAVINRGYKWRQRHFQAWIQSFQAFAAPFPADQHVEITPDRA
jgi:hypothetical protein